MEANNIKINRGFAILNIIMGVILFMSSFIMFTDEDTGPGGFIVLPLGLLLWITGACALYIRKKQSDDKALMKRTRLMNIICFILSCIMLAMVVLLPIIAPHI